MKIFNSNIKLYLLILLFCKSIFALSQTSTQQKFHDTKGNIEVTKAGQLQYTMNIDLPPGIKEVSPNVSLIYNSGGRNGLAGYNWNITGLSSISRVGKYLEKDGITKGVQLDYSDYYSYNGQRLILKSGEYGKDGAEYVTEKYSNVKIKSVGTISGQLWQGPEYWEVTFEDGSQAWFGATSSGNSSARTPTEYNIVKSKDINGNFITYNYILEDNISIISNIQWGGNEALNKPNFNKIEFAFEARPMPETAYIKGIAFIQSKMLQSIIVSNNNVQFKKYNVTYKKDLQQTTYRYLEKIIVLNSNNEEANPVIFTYDKGIDDDYYDNDFNVYNDVSLKFNKDIDAIGDFDGDGNLDLLRYHSVTSSRIPQIGIYLYSNFYRVNYNNENPKFIGNSITLLEFKNAIAVNLKKNNLIHNRQGFVTKKQVINPSTSKYDLELSFYSITENNQMILDYKKVILNINYDNTSGTTQNGTRTSIIGLKNIDFNSDGLSEIVLVLKDRTCWSIDINESTAKLPHECEEKMRYYIIDPDESIQNNGWYYTLNLYSNPDEDDAFEAYRSGDFNGDGVNDFIKLNQNKNPLLITFSKNFEGKYVSSISPFNTSNNQIVNGYWDSSLVGDFNGDGLSDIMLPQTNTSNSWYLYTSKGKGFKEESVNFLAPRLNRIVNQDLNNNIQIYNPRTFVSYDINNDGKAELLALESRRIYIKEFIQDSNQGAKYTTQNIITITPYSTTKGEYTISGYAHYGIETAFSQSIVYLNNTNINNQLAVGLNDFIGLSVDQWTGAMLRKIAMVSAIGFAHDFGDAQRLLSYQYFDIARIGRIKSISQGGITTDITYKQLDKTINPGLYDISQTVNYPFVEINQSTGMFVVAQIVQNISADKKLKQDFRYRGLTSNILGRGMIGFRKTARSSWYADGFENTKIWSGLEIDPLNEGIPIKEWSIRTNSETNIFPTDVSEDNTQLLNFKSSTYQIDKILNGQVVTTVTDADKPNVVTAIIPKITKAKDFLTNVIAENTITYGEYYLPTTSISKINTSYATTTSSYSYSNNPSGVGANYYIGRPISKTEIVSAYGDSKSSKEEFTYENNRIKTSKTWNSDNTAFSLDNFTYDNFGNITQKISANSVDSQTITSGYEYDNKGRFLLKQTDNLGLQIQTTYNDWGQILTKTDPFNNTITNTYDNWGKILTSTSNLGGTTSYLYEKDSNSNVIITQNEPGGNISKKFTNKFGQDFKTSTKAFGQGQYVSQETQYDVLGRKIKESEPYFEGQSANQWNIITYDDSIFPTKITATSFNGKQSSTTVSGLTTTVEELNGYGRITSKTADALGNIISTTDKGGTIQFSYNAAGQQTQAKYAENTVITKYDSWGRKSEFHDPSNGLYKYEYDGFGRAKKTISPKGKKEYTYNNFGQLISQTELSNDGGVATNKSISYSYDNKGRIISKSGTANGNSYSSIVTYDNNGRLLFSTENSNGKIFSQQEIVYDGLSRIISYEKKLESSGITTNVEVENLYSAWNGELYQMKDKNSGKILWELNNTNAKGQVLTSKLGSSIISNTYDTNSFLTNINHSSATGSSILQIDYEFDAIKNELKSRTTTGDFNILESFDYDDNNRLINWTDPVSGIKPSIDRNKYDNKGRIKMNDQVGEILFEDTAKIYQPTSMALNDEGDNNYLNDLTQIITYNENNDPVFIDGVRGDVAFKYGLSSMRQLVTYGENFNSEEEGAFTKYYNEDGSFEIIKNNKTGLEKHIIYIGGSPYESNIAYIKNYEKSEGSYIFLHKDYLGSILAITDEKGNKIEQRHFDAWGNLTHLKIASNEIITEKEKIREYLSTGSLILDRGYTSHEHFAEVALIHMNGRLYDPLLRRFLNADENIQDPTNTQNYNKYGYVMNNPMMFSDPDGEFWWWLAGALVGGYMNGVQANGGQWNPGKWNWESTWSAVLGGAIGGASISGALGNISSNPGAIKSFLPGIVSGGLNSAFSGGNFLSGAIGGISYNSNVFDNKVTSTDAVNAGYRYIISPKEDNTGGGWEDLTKSILLNYVRNNFCVSCSMGTIQQMAGTKFEEAFHRIMRIQFAPVNYTSNKDKFQGMYKGRPRNTVPDAVFDLINVEVGYHYNKYELGPFSISVPIPDGTKLKRYYGASFAEVKAMDGTLYSSSNNGQLASMLSYLGSTAPVRSIGGIFIIGTTSDTIISPSLFTLASGLNITISQYKANYRMISGAMQIKFNCYGCSITTMLK